MNPDFRNPHNVNQKMIFKIGIVSTLTPAVRRPRSTQPNPTHIPGEQGAQSRVTSVSQFARAGEVIARTVSSLRSRSVHRLREREITRRGWKVRIAAAVIAVGRIDSYIVVSLTINRVGHLVADLGWVDFVFCCSTVSQIMLGHMRIRQY